MSYKEKYWEIVKKYLHSRQVKKDNSEESHSQQDRDYLYPVYKAEQEKKRFSSEKNIVDTLSHLVKNSQHLLLNLTFLMVIH